MDERRIFGIALRTERIRRGLTRQAFAEMIDMTPQALEDLERGRGPASVAQLFHIGMVLERAPATMLEEPRPDDAPLAEREDLLIHLRGYMKS